MEFRLHYRGDLPANGSIKDKQRIRRVFHKQISELWQQKPLVQVRKLFLEPNPPGIGNPKMTRHIGNFIFAPLVCENLQWTATIDIILLKPEPPGKIITQAGDLDNRLKTLLDALRMPTNDAEIPKADKPNNDENPFFCLLEDDNLLTGISIVSDRLLETTHSKSEVEMLIKVCTTLHRQYIMNTKL